MSKYMVIYHYADGTDEEDDNYGAYWDSEEDAKEAGLYGLSCYKLAAKSLKCLIPVTILLMNLITLIMILKW